MATTWAHQTLGQYLRKHGISSTHERIDHRSDRVADEWDMMARHWRVTIRRGHRRMTVQFSQGPAHTEPPTTDDVIDCLASDAATFEQTGSFEDWCSELGFDPDSRKAERMYRAVEKQARSLRRVIDDERAYDELLYHTERL